MRKLLATFTAGVVIAGAAATNVSAEEYKVQEGDSLWSIADEYSTTVDNIVDENELDSKTIHPDQTITVGNKEVYKVEEGDTLDSIAEEFDVKVKDIKDWNDLDSDLIIVGDELDLEDVTVDKDDNDSSDNAEASEENTEESSDNAEDTEDAKEETQDNAKEETEETATKDESTEEESENAEASEGESVNVSATAYTASCDGCSGVTSTGTDLEDNPDEKVIAVDPDVIPLGSEVHVEGYGDAVAADTGGDINGDKIDVHVPDEGEANSWGVKDVEVTILD